VYTIYEVSGSCMVGGTSLKTTLVFSFGGTKVYFKSIKGDEIILTTGLLLLWVTCFVIILVLMGALLGVMI
jgi:hypothetical protein